jgi:hypothetical protein
MAAKAAAIPGSSGLLVCTVDSDADSDSVAIKPTAVWGWSAFSAAASVFGIYDGTSTGGVLLDTVELAAGVEQTIEFPDPLEVDSGSIFINFVSGTPTGEILWG